MSLTENEAAEENIKHQTEKTNDKDLLLHLRDIDLIAKEFQMHDVCYKTYLRECNDDLESTSGESQDDFEAVKAFVKENVIELNQAVSMVKVHEIIMMATWVIQGTEVN